MGNKDSSNKKNGKNVDDISKKVENMMKQDKKYLRQIYEEKRRSYQDNDTSTQKPSSFSFCTQPSDIHLESPSKKNHVKYYLFSLDFK